MNANRRLGLLEMPLIGKVSMIFPGLAFGMSRRWPLLLS